MATDRLYNAIRTTRWDLAARNTFKGTARDNASQRAEAEHCIP